MIRLDFADPKQPGLGLRCAFEAPLEILTAQTPKQVLALLDAVEAYAKAGLWCVGYLQYEAASAFDAALMTHPGQGALAWFAVFDQAQAWPDDETGDNAEQTTLQWHQAPSRAEFNANLARLHQGIEAGEFYQVNYTAKLHGHFSGDPLALFKRLRQAQPNSYAAFINTGTAHILSVSPELFFDWDGQHILTRPMKGTARRGDSAPDDQAHIQALLRSAKEKAENVMIVDLLRNDLSRIAQAFSVKVPRLFAVQTLPTVHQMVSDVSASTKPGTRLRDVFAALFPCGSITGTPKVRAMQAICAIETQPRGVYCGAIGVVRPGGHATFNVAIRSLTLTGQQASFGIGSGITFDARQADEWDEWQLKYTFLLRASEPFALLETMRLQGGQIRHMSAHLARLAKAAQHFGYALDQAAVRARLQALVESSEPAAPAVWRLRLQSDKKGHIKLDKSPHADSPQPVWLALADQPFGAANSEFTRFKTTQRSHYEAFKPKSPELFDTLLYNEQGQLTECTCGNIAVLLDGQWQTPALQCGLLAGIERDYLLQQGRLKSAIITLSDLQRAQGLAFINSLRGWLPAKLVGTAATNGKPSPGSRDA